jgi:hypothetical protein
VTRAAIELTRAAIELTHAAIELTHAAIAIVIRVDARARAPHAIAAWVGPMTPWVVAIVANPNAIAAWV